MTRGAVVFLILLRLAIGWHFLYEGLQKVQSTYVGQTVTGRPFSSAGYLREATGPLAGLTRWTLGDVDAEALSLLAVKPVDSSSEPATVPPHLRTPPGLARDWEAYLVRFEQHYHLNDVQRAEARGRVEQAEDHAVLFLTQDQPDEETPELKRSFPTGEVMRRVPTAERIAEYRRKLDEVQDVLGRKLWLFGRDVEKARLRQAKVELAQLRTALLKDLDRHTQALTRSLNLVVAEPVLTPLEHLDNDLIRGRKLLAGKKNEALQKVVNDLQGTAEETRELAPLTPAGVGVTPVTPLDAEKVREQLLERAASLRKYAEALGQSAGSDEVKRFATDVEEDAKDLAAGAGELAEVGPLVVTGQTNKTLEWVDFLTRWGLTVIGACLLLGLLTRTNAWLAAGFLFMTYLAMPAFPWLPAAAQSEGNYLFVNKNVIEMLALCVIGTTHTGRWFGVDSVLSWFGKKS